MVAYNCLTEIVLNGSFQIKKHIIWRNTVRSMRESRALSWPSRAQYVKEYMSDFGMILEIGPIPYSLAMNKDCSKWIVAEQSILNGGTQLGAREKIKPSFGRAWPCM